MFVQLILNVTDAPIDFRLEEAYMHLLENTNIIEEIETENLLYGGMAGKASAQSQTYVGTLDFVEPNPRYILVLFEGTKVFVQSVEELIELK
jgi:hypothetical protein